MQNAVAVSFENTEKAFSSRSDKELRKMHLLFSFMKQEIPVKIGSFFLKTALSLRFPINIFIKNNLYKLFCGGETLKEVSSVVERLKAANIQTILDYGMEAGSEEESYGLAFSKILDTIDFASKQQGLVLADFKITALAHFDVLQKVQEGKALSETENKHLEEVRRKLDIIGQACMEKNVPVMVDAEESWIQGTIDALTYSLMMKYNKDKCLIYNTIQMYRADGADLLEDALLLAEKENFKLGIKLVRGAYMDKERCRARELDVPSPIWNTKEETDQAFDAALEFSVKNRNRMSICCGSHNEKSNYFLIKLIDDHKIDRNDPRFLFSQLYGMSDHITYNLAAAGFNVAKYIPYGPVKHVIPYLLRRADENKAIAGQTSRELKLIEKEIKRRGV